MATRAQVLVPVAAAAAIVGAAGILSIPEEARPDYGFSRGTVEIGGRYLSVQVAETPAQRTTGLMFQERLPYDEGMLFVFESEGVHPIWMLNMQFPLDILWLDADRRVVHIERGVEPCVTAVEAASCPTVSNAGAPAAYVLEVTAGLVDELGVEPGDVMDDVSI